ncbi:hypothetical protein N9N45_07095 [Planktomarina temperata]|nr:hypothetical protein [Planktomarina temperata]
MSFRLAIVDQTRRTGQRLMLMLALLMRFYALISASVKKLKGDGLENLHYTVESLVANIAVNRFL